MESTLLDVAGHRRSPATMPGYHRGRPPRNKGEQYPADPPTVERSSQSCAQSATTPTGTDSARSSSCSGAPVCESAKRCRSRRATSTDPAARCSSGGAYAEFGIAHVMPGRSLCRGWSLVVVCWLLSGGSVG
jgi:hypothetical protein